ncbi:defensin beta 118-like isoform X2 [Antechinus flavipes]|uniref:defensin beta 118-like isoform X2 n=1 Tax=Antechinus flavipes TaxID=38775 RepID=UPI0022356247|nr:defensin beta 118-like isoform X2 [Antechinus flavipes]
MASLGSWADKKCCNNAGRCRNHCKRTESNHSTCADRRKGCVPFDKLRKESEDNSTLSEETMPSLVGALTTSAPTDDNLFTPNAFLTTAAGGGSGIATPPAAATPAKATPPAKPAPFQAPTAGGDFSEE